ncbi:MAG: hypothetical protein DRJ35_00130 [Thermoprotei archaeon]|nr:MAG: hypothetical protein DRJ35_00130 [Thermoprotei archaeon]
MFKKIAIIGMNYLSLSFVNWLRKISPRYRIDIFTERTPQITSPRRLRNMNSSPKDALYATPSYIRYLFFPRIFLSENLANTVPEKLSEKYDLVFLFKEPYVESEKHRFNLSNLEGWTRLLTQLKDSCIVFEPCLVCAQLAIYLRNIGVKSYISEKLKNPTFPRDFEKIMNLFFEETGLFDYKKGCVELRIKEPNGKVEMYVGGQVDRSYIVENYLDENIEQVAFSLVLDVLGIDHKKPLNVIVVERQENFLFLINREMIKNNVSTTKIGLGDKNFVRVISDRNTNTIYTIYGRLKGAQLNVLESFISLFLSPNISENIPYIAVAKSPLLREMPVLQSNLYLWRKNLPRKLVQISLSTEKLGFI